MRTLLEPLRRLSLPRPRRRRLRADKPSSESPSPLESFVWQAISFSVGGGFAIVARASLWARYRVISPLTRSASKVAY